MRTRRRINTAGEAHWRFLIETAVLRLLLSGFTHKVRCIVGVAASFVLGALRICAQWPRHCGVLLVLGGILRGDDRRRRSTLLHPLFESRIHAVLRIVEG